MASSVDKTFKNKNDSKEHKNKNDDKSSKESSTTKHISMIIFGILILFLVIYVIYSFEAYKNGWFPFGNYVTIPPEEGYQPTVNPTSGYNPSTFSGSENDRLKAAGFTFHDQDERESINDAINTVLTNNCAWWCNGQFYPSGQPDSPIGNTNTAKIALNNNTNFGDYFWSLFGIGNDPKKLYYNQRVLKPSSDQSGGPGCDCGTGGGNYPLVNPIQT